jgi:subtilisin family serine protease
MPEERITLVTTPSRQPQAPRRRASPGSRPMRRAIRGLRGAVALVLSIVVALAGVGIAWAAPGPIGLDAPIHAFAWPFDAPPNDHYFGLQTELAPIGVAAAWTRATGAPSVVVAVLDSGIDATNPEFAGRIVPGFNALTGEADTTANFAPTDDGAGHGTHVSGTIAAAGDNATGIVGIAPSVSIMPVKVLSDEGEGDFGDLIDGIDWAVAHGARIITMSLGGTLSPSAAAFVQHTCDGAYAAGAVVLAASGNDGTVVDQYPCNFSHVICVGSATNDGTAVSSFSTRTSALALVAPGERIASTLPGGGYGYGSGTSMATPHVTGAVALLRTLRPGLTPDEVFAGLTQTARPLDGGGRSPASGYGLLQVGAAVDRIVGFGPLPTPSPAASPTPAPTPTPTPDPNATPTPIPTPGPTLYPVPEPILIIPSVTASSPHNGARSVARAVRPRITFSVPMSGVSTRTITMKDLSRGRWVTIRVTYSAAARTATLSPAVRLAANHSYRITVARVLSANEGAPLGKPFVFTFRTGYR